MSNLERSWVIPGGTGDKMSDLARDEKPVFSATSTDHEPTAGLRALIDMVGDIRKVCVRAGLPVNNQGFLELCYSIIRTKTHSTEGGNDFRVDFSVKAAADGRAGSVELQMQITEIVKGQPNALAAFQISQTMHYKLENNESVNDVQEQ